MVQRCLKRFLPGGQSRTARDKAHALFSIPRLVIVTVVAGLTVKRGESRWIQGVDGPALADHAPVQTYNVLRVTVDHT